MVVAYADHLLAQVHSKVEGLAIAFVVDIAPGPASRTAYPDAPTRQADRRYANPHGRAKPLELMVDARLSYLQMLRQETFAAMREVNGRLSDAAALAAELKALSLRTGSAEGYDEAVRAQAVVEDLRARLEAVAAS